MSNLAETNQVFFEKTGLDATRIEGIVADALSGADDGELYLEYRKSEALSWDDGKLKSASHDVTQGFGLRAVTGEVSGYAHAAELSEAAIKRAASTVRAISSGHDGDTLDLAPRGTNSRLYMPESPLESHALETKLKVMADIDAYARGRDSRVRQVMISLTGSWQAVQIMRPGAAPVADIRPLVRLQVTVMLGEGERQETGSYGAGGRVALRRIFAAERLGRPLSMKPFAVRASTLAACLPPLARWSWCWAPAGPACCCTRRSATGWKAISIASRHPRFRT